MSYNQRARALRNMETISVAPGENGEFRNWKKDVFLEEQCFPSLFPYGTGGYLSSCISSGKNMGFAVYCRNRMKSVDSKYRNDQVYVFFLLLVKEIMELQNCKATYFRQARNTPGLSKDSLTNARYQSLERYSRSFSVFKKMRGTAMYYEAAKKQLMATLRQRGPPTVFITLSSAEYHWSGLLKSVYETVYKKPATDEELDKLSASEKSKLITENVVQTTLHFNKRIEKIMRLIIIPGYLEKGYDVDNLEQDTSTSNDEEEKTSPSYFYR